MNRPHDGKPEAKRRNVNAITTRCCLPEVSS